MTQLHAWKYDFEVRFRLLQKYRGCGMLELHRLSGEKTGNSIRHKKVFSKPNYQPFIQNTFPRLQLRIAKGALDSTLPENQANVASARKIIKAAAQRVSDSLQAPTDTIPIPGVLHPTKKLKLIVPKVEKQKLHVNQSKKATTPNYTRPYLGEV